MSVSLTAYLLTSGLSVTFLPLRRAWPMAVAFSQKSPFDEGGAFL
ncbi:hypothetical protein [uncultured Hymenobacter sp.]